MRTKRQWAASLLVAAAVVAMGTSIENGARKHAIANASGEQRHLEVLPYQKRHYADPVVADVHRAIVGSWRVPAISRRLSAEVEVALTTSGAILSATITQASGHVDFDRSVMQAIEDGAPFLVVADIPLRVRGQYRSYLVMFSNA